MKVLHIVSFYAPAYRYGGPIGSVHGLNKALVKKGVDVTVYTTNMDGGGALPLPANTPIDRDGVHVHYFEPSPGGRWWEYSHRLHRTMKATVKNFDVVHITGVFRAASFVGARTAKKNNIPYLISPRGTLMEKPLTLHHSLGKKIYLSFFEKYNLSHAAAIHFTVPREEEEYVAAGLPLRKSVIIPNSIDGETFPKNPGDGRFRKSLHVSEKTPIVLFLGRLNWKKGFDTLIPAWKEVREKHADALLVIAGGDDEGYRTKIEDMIHDAGVRDSVVFTGMLEGEDRVAAFSESDIFILPSYSENFGMAPVEAAYFGLPVIVTDGVGIAPDIEAFKAGLVVPKEVAAVSNAITGLLSDVGRRRNMGEAGKHLVESRFRTEAVADRFIEVYNELKDGKRT
ncbi:MAG: glycosyltransferase [Patescibacteria group bacterium]